MTNIAELQTRVNTATRDLRQSYRRTVETVTALKKEIGDLELCMSQEARVRTDSDARRLDSLLEKLDTLTDSLILENARVKRKCGRLECECRIQAVEPRGLKDLRALSLKHEELAKDLVCYSLGRLRRRNSVQTRRIEE